MGRRPLWTAVLALVLAAGALWGASALAWGGELKPRPGTDVPIAVTVTGAEVAPALVPVALLALAGVAGLLALAGLWRRLLGPVLAAAAVYPIWAGLGAQSPSWGAAAAVAGGVLLVVAGVVVALTGHRMPRMGSRYAAPSTGREAEPDLWRSLSEGDDPTDAQA
ncbi:Trp biosynthesis-associated membrane protein [Actinokineospora sp. NPDC004072]